jgi:hypothetical protein
MFCYAECRYEECHFAQCRYDECRGAYAEDQHLTRSKLGHFSNKRQKVYAAERDNV